MKNWINLFEKYRVDRRLLDIHRDKLDSLSDSSPRRLGLMAEITRIERSLHAAERLLSHYGDRAATDREAVRLADERLFLAYRYINDMTMEAIADEMCVSRDTVYRIRRRILQHGDIPDDYLALYCKHSGYTESDIDNYFDSPGHPLFPAPPGRLDADPLAADPDCDDIDDVLAACFAGAPDRSATLWF